MPGVGFKTVVTAAGQVIDDARFRRSPYRGDSGRSQPFWSRARQRNGASIHRHALHEPGKLG